MKAVTTVFWEEGLSGAVGSASDS